MVRREKGRRGGRGGERKTSSRVLNSSAPVKRPPAGSWKKESKKERKKERKERKERKEGREGKGRKERKGKERKGKERKGKERKGKERKGKERKGKERNPSINERTIIRPPSKWGESKRNS